MRSKIIFLFIFLLLAPCVSWAQIGDYDPDNPDDPGAARLRHTLTLIASPGNSCYMDVPTSRVVEGSTFYLYAAPRNGFRFVAWLLPSGDTLSLSPEYLFTMPDSDLVLTARLVYDPSNPPDPHVTQRTKRLSLSANPANGGSFNFRDGRVPINEIVSLYAYPNRDYEFVYWSINDTVLSNNPELDYAMPNRDVQIVAHYRYNPSNPSNPGANSANLNGNILIDDFDPGRLVSTIADVLERANMTYNEVRRLSINGVMRSYDFGIAEYFPNCHYIDISQVSGITSIPSRAFNHAAVDTIVLPATINSIADYTFANCRSLSAIYCYAIMPPSVQSTSFDSVFHSSVDVYVPSTALALYQGHPVWSTFRLHSMQESSSNLTVSIPQTIPISNLYGMKLVLTSLTNSQRQYLVMTNNRLYSFANLQDNSSWRITVENQQNNVFGLIDSIYISHSDTTVSLWNILLPQDISINVSANGEDVTDQVQVSWFTQDGSFMHRGSTLQQVAQNTDVKYQIALSRSLTFEYASIPITNYHVGTNNNISLVLIPRDTVRVNGTVKDSTTHEMLSNVTLNVVQTFDGIYQHSILLKTDSRGFYSGTLFKVPTRIEVMSDNHYDKTVEVDSLWANTGLVATLPTIELRNHTSGFVSLDFSYQLACEENGTPTKYPYFSDYMNVRYTLFNRTQNRHVEDVTVSYPILKVHDETNIGDIIDIRASSIYDAFYPVDTFFVFDTTMHGTASFNVIEKGKIVASCGTMTNNPVAILYDSVGVMISRKEYGNSDVVFDNLNDGIYTVVSMENHSQYSHIASLQNLERLGLVADEDYWMNTVLVSHGRINNIYNDSVPQLADANLGVLTSNSSFTSDGCEVGVGNMVTLRANIEIKPSFYGHISAPTLVIDLPQGCTFVGNSVIVNNQTRPCSNDDNQLFISLPTVQGLTKVRLCVRAESSGNLIQSAYFRYASHGVTSMNPIGTTNVKVVGFHIDVPKYVGTPNIPVTGTADPGATVSIYDANEMIGQAQANANGRWSFTYHLDGDKDYERCSIWARYRNTNNQEMISDVKICQYFVTLNEVSSVTMFYDNSICVFDFRNPNSHKQSYLYKTGNTHFTFTIDFVDNRPETVLNSDVTLWVKLSNNTWRPLNVQYDSLQNKWIAEGEFGAGQSPVNVSVEYKLPQTSPTLSRSRFNEIASLFFDVNTGLDNDIQQTSQAVNLMFSAIEDTTIQESIVDRMIDSLCFELGIDTTGITEYYADSTELISAMASLDSILNDPYWVGIDSLLAMTVSERMNYQDLLRGITLEDCIGIDTSWLASQGYSRQLMTDSSIAYVKITDSIFDFVDLTNHVRYRMNLSEMQDIDSGLVQLLFSSSKAGIISIAQLQNGITELRNKFRDLSQSLSKLTNALEGIRATIKGIALKLNEPIKKNLKNLLYLYRNQDNAASRYLVDESRGMISRASNMKKASRWMDNVLDKISGFKALNAINLLGNLNDAINDLSEIVDIYQNLPNPCNGPDSSIISITRRDLTTLGAASLSYYVLNVGLNIISLNTAMASAATLIPTAGLSSAALIGSITTFLANIAIQQAYTMSFEMNLQNIKIGIPVILHCTPQEDPEEEDPEDPQNPQEVHETPVSQNPGEGVPSKTPDARPAIDPSGYVYEGVPSNRIEGVKASCFFKEYEEMPNGDIEEVEMFWDASEFEQENPLYTDAEGVYQWFVPQGLWKVVFEKMGYETTQTDWLPVPPPQLEVNVGIVQNSHPEVKMAHAYPDAVELEFDKYMIPLLLNTNNITVTQNGMPVSGAIEFLNEESADTLNAPSFVSKIRFNADSAFTSNQVTLHISSRVKSYANVAMQSDYIQAFTVEPEISMILCDSIINVTYGRDMNITVSVLPATAAVGKTLRIRSLSTDLLSTLSDSVVLGASGQASFTVHGNLPGTTTLFYSIDGYDNTAYSIVQITRNSCNPVYSVQDTSVCDVFSYGNSVYYESCTIQNTYMAVTGCDSIFSIRLTVYHSTQDSSSATICNGQSLTFGQTELTNPGVYTNTLTTSNQCDSVVTLTLMVNSTSASTEQIVVCDSLEWHGTVYTSSNNTATFTSQNTNGCDSIITLDLTVNHSNTSIDEISTCDSILWIDNITYTTSNQTATYVLANAAGCDSTIMLDLTIRPSYTITFNENDGVGQMPSTTSCSGVTILLPHCTFSKENFFFAGWSLSAEGTVLYTDGDTITPNRDLTLYAIWSSSCVTAYETSLETVCDSIHWRNNDYYISNTYYDTVIGVNLGGCDSVYVLHLTVNYSNTYTDNKISCDSFSWHGTTYVTSTDTPTYVTINAAGCDSVITLNLTVNYSSEVTDIQSACDSYTWNGNTYTSSTSTPTKIEQNAAGCDSVITLNLTVNYSSEATDIQSACDSLTWIDGITYTTTTQEPQFTLVNEAGCDSLVTLDLTVNYSSETEEIRTISNADLPYSFGDQMFVDYGNYDVLLQTEAGCDSLIHLYLNHSNDIDDRNLISVNIYPNPTDGWVYIHSDEVEKVVVVDMLGRKVAQWESNRIDLSRMPAGNYYLYITTRSGLAINRVVKR